MPPVVTFDGVWKKFRRGERHDSLRDLIPALARRFRRRAPDPDAQEFWALRDVSFSVERGEALGIIGANGAGKSTALKLLTRVLKPTCGETIVRGRAGALIEVAAGFHPDLTGRENVFLQGAIMGMKRAEIGARFDEIVEFAGVGPFVDTQVKRYSSGMNARLGFSIAAHLDPDVLFIDEVLSVGDLAFQQKCESRMHEFLGRGVAIVFVSHNLLAIGELCKRTLLLESGRTRVLGPTPEAITQYCAGSTSSDADGASIAATIRLRDRVSREPVPRTRPGESLLVAVDVAFQVSTDAATVGLVVWDVTRGTYVYGASSDAVGLGRFRAAAGERLSLDLDLQVNLTRGQYAIEINVVDLVGHRFLAVARGICHFAVDEDVSYNGVANLFLAGRVVDRGAQVRRDTGRAVSSTA